MNYRNIYRALSVKNALNIYMEIYNGCLTEEYKSFENLRQSFKIGKDSLRRITNRLSSCGLIKSLKDTHIGDGRKRIYVVVDLEITENIKNLTNLIMK